MEPMNFKQGTTIFAKDQPEYLPLPAHLGYNGRVTSCWGMTWRERIRLLFTGRIWLQTLTFNQPLQPQKLSVEMPVMAENTGPHSPPKVDMKMVG